jgi:hypothetical protein
MIEHHMANEYFSTSFSSPILVISKQRNPNDQMIHHHMTIENFWILFCSAILCISKKKMLDTYRNRTSHGKWRFLRIFLFSYSVHFEEKNGSLTRWSNITCPMNISQHRSVHLFSWFRRRGNQIDHMIYQHITNENFSILLCSAILFITDKRMRDSSDDWTWHDKWKFLTTVPSRYSVHLNEHNAPLIKSSNITRQTKIPQNNSVHIFRSFWRRESEIDQMIEHNITNEYFSASFYSPILVIRRRESQIDQMIDHHITNENFSIFFCSAILSILNNRMRDSTDDRT